VKSPVMQSRICRQIGCRPFSERCCRWYIQHQNSKNRCRIWYNSSEIIWIV